MTRNAYALTQPEPGWPDTPATALPNYPFWSASWQKPGNMELPVTTKSWNWVFDALPPAFMTTKANWWQAFRFLHQRIGWTKAGCQNFRPQRKKFHWHWDTCPAAQRAPEIAKPRAPSIPWASKAPAINRGFLLGPSSWALQKRGLTPPSFSPALHHPDG